MPQLRLKEYTREIYVKYVRLIETIYPYQIQSTEAKRITASLSMICETVLFFNQPMPSQSLEEWSESCPDSYLLLIDKFIATMVECYWWSMISINTGDELNTLKINHRIILDINNLRITAIDGDERDVVKTQFVKTCTMIHEILPYNLRTRKSLIRLIRAYFVNKELRMMSKELNDCDAITHLKRIIDL